MDAKTFSAFLMSNGVVGAVRDAIVKDREKFLMHIGLGEAEARAIMTALEDVPEVAGQGLGGQFDFTRGSIALSDYCVAPGK